MPPVIILIAWLHPSLSFLRWVAAAVDQVVRSVETNLHALNISINIRREHTQVKSRTNVMFVKSVSPKEYIWLHTNEHTQGKSRTNVRCVISRSPKTQICFNIRDYTQKPPYLRNQLS